MPAVGILAASVTDVVPQVAAPVWSGPAAATVVAATLVITTSSKVAVQGAFEIVHLKVFAPTPKPVIPEVGLLGVVIVPVPLINVQAPVPTVAVLPANVAVVAQTVWSDAALAVVGFLLKVIITSSVEAVQGALAIVQRKV